MQQKSANANISQSSVISNNTNHKNSLFEEASVSNNTVVNFQNAGDNQQPQKVLGSVDGSGSQTRQGGDNTRNNAVMSQGSYNRASGRGGERSGNRIVERNANQLTQSQKNATGMSNVQGPFMQNLNSSFSQKQKSKSSSKGPPSSGKYNQQNNQQFQHAAGGGQGQVNVQ